MRTRPLTEATFALVFSLAISGLLAFSTLVITIQVADAPFAETFSAQFWGRIITLGGVLLLASMPSVHRAVGWLIIRPRVLSGTIAALMLLFWGGLKVQEHTIIDGTRCWWLFDDALISMRYAYHLANGDGLVWNIGEYVEGYSNPLWVLVMAGVHLLPLSLAHTSLVVGVLNVALAALLIPVTARLVTLLGGTPTTRFIVLIALASNLYLAYWTLEGAEATLLALLWTWTIVVLLEDGQNGSVRIRPFLILGLLTLVRADAVVLVAIGVSIALLLLWPSVTPHQGSLVAGKLLGGVALVAVPFLLHLGWRVAYYGDWLPNTAYLKLAGVQKIVNGLAYLAAAAYAFPLVTLIGLLFPPQERIQRILWSSTLVYAGYLLLIGGDVFGFGYCPSYSRCPFSQCSVLLYPRCRRA
jgi:hypothetical protein